MRVGKGALCAVPTICLDLSVEWWARFALPTLRKLLSLYFVSGARSSLRAKRSNPWSRKERMDCFVAEPVIGRAFARPVGSSQ